MSRNLLKRTRHIYSLVFAVAISGLVAVALWSTASAQTPLGVNGYLDFAYQGWGGPGNPTGEKPQSKLWWHDGFWWGSLYSSAHGEFRIHRLNWGTQTWEDTGVAIDDRTSTKADAVMDNAANKLYILSHYAVLSDSKTVNNNDKLARLYRYTYDPVMQRYNLDTGFPSDVNSDEAESMVLAKDSAGHLWVAWVSRGITKDEDPGGRVYQVYVTHSSDDGASWGNPFVPNLGASQDAVVSRGDVATIVAFGDQVGVMWNRSQDNTLHFAHRAAGGANLSGEWGHQVINSTTLSAGADDHVSLQSWQVTSSGVVVAAIKTNAKTSDPITEDQVKSLIGIVVRNPANGTFAFREYSRNVDKDTRPIVVIDQGNPSSNGDDRVYVFVTGKEGGSKICYKSIPLTTPVTNMQAQFDGDTPTRVRDCGTSLIEDGVYKTINDATSMRNNTNQHTGIVVLASDVTTTTNPVGTYVHGILGDPAPVVTGRTPGLAAVDVPLDASITVTFSKSMEGSSLNATTFSVWEGAAQVTGEVTFDGTRSAVFTPQAPLKAYTTYTVKLTNNIQDTSGKRLNAFDGAAAGTVVEEWQFTTAGGTVQFEFDSYLVVENDGPATVTVKLNAPSGQPVSVDYATSDGTATAGIDYTAANGTLTFAPGETVQTFTVDILDNVATDGDRTVNLALSNPVSATLGIPEAAVLTIVDDESPVSIRFNPTAYSVNEVSGSATLTVTLSHPDNVNPITVDYATSDGTAEAGSDYAQTNGTLTFDPGQTAKTITVPIINDDADEPDETLTVELSSPTGGDATLGNPSTATVTIVDDDFRPSVRFDPASYNAGEGSGNATLTVKLSAPSAQPVTVKYATVPGGTATPDADYTATSGTLTFDPGITTQTFTIPVLEDALHEDNETIHVTLSEPGNATLGTPFGAAVTIEDNDAPPAVQFAEAASSKGERAGTVEIEVVLNTVSGRQVLVDYANTGGTATPDNDFGAIAGTLSIAPGQTSAIFELVILDDVQDETDETIILTLSNPVNATLGTPASHTITIKDDDEGQDSSTGVFLPMILVP